MKALSIRQPYAWLIVNGFKDIENRSWKTFHRGPVLIHASKAMARDEYAFAHCLAEEQGIVLPPIEELERGGIVGRVNIVDCVDKDPSPWFFGEYGFLLEKAAPLPFQPCTGRLGFFNPDPQPKS